MLLFKLILLKIQGYKMGQFITVFLLTLVFSLLLGGVIVESIITSIFATGSYAVFKQLLFIVAGEVLEITRYSHKICMRMTNILNIKNCDIKKMFLDDFDNLSKIKELKKWNNIKTTTHTIIAYELINTILKKNNQKSLKRTEFSKIINKVITIEKCNQTFYLKIKKKKKPMTNCSLVYKYRLSELMDAIKAGVFKKIDFYDIKIDVKLLLD